MGRGSNHQALDARGLLYGTRSSGRGPQLFHWAETPSSIFKMLCQQGVVPKFLTDEFPDCEITGVSNNNDPQEQKAGDSIVNLSGINPDKEKSLGILFNGKRSLYYLDETQPLKEEPPTYLLPGNREERRFLRCLADNSHPGQEVEFTVYKRAQMRSLLDNYGDKNLRLASEDYKQENDEAAALKYFWDSHPLLDSDQIDNLSHIQTMQELLAISGGREILTTYLDGGRPLNIIADLDCFRSHDS